MPKRIRLINIPAAVAAFVLCVIAIPLPSNAEEAAVPAANEQFDVADLERAFWACDYVATTQGVSAAPIAACRFATEQLKRQKFGGKFEDLLTWWRNNKAAEHARMERLAHSDAIS